MPHPSLYSPLNVLKPVALDIWIADGGPFRIAGLLPVPVRMTVLRLKTGVMLHSPISWSRELQEQIGQIGPIRHLVAPNPFHWSFIPDWQRHCPDALVWAAEMTKSRRSVRKSSLKIDHELSDAPPADWISELDQVVIRARHVFREVAFFHRATRTLVLTDLVVNLERDKLVWYARNGVATLGSMAGHGRAPFYARILFRMNRAEAEPAAARLIAFKPERVIFSHGRWFDRDGAATRLKSSLQWLLTD